MTQKIVIAKPGYNAITETNADNLVFSSDYDTLKYHASGTVSLSVSGSDKETSITHGLGYIPFFVVYVNNFASASSSNFSMVPAVFSGFPALYATANAYADSSKIYFKFETNTASATYTFYYKIFRNRVNI